MYVLIDEDNGKTDYYANDDLDEAYENLKQRQNEYLKNGNGTALISLFIAKIISSIK